MVVKLTGGRRDDDRVQRILRDPAGYFADARRKAREQVEREMAQEQRRPRRNLPST